MENRKKDDTVGEEISALGQRVKGAVKDVAGDIADDRGLEREGERENAEGRARQATNNVMDETDGVRGATVGTPAYSREGYVTGLYPTPEAATRAYEGLTTTHGYKADDIDVMMSDDTRKRHFGDVTPGTELAGGTKAVEGMGKGGAIGGGIGAALAALSRLAPRWSFRVFGWSSPGQSPRLSPARAPAAPRVRLIGALIGAGIPEDRARNTSAG